MLVFHASNGIALELLDDLISKACGSPVQEFMNPTSKHSPIRDLTLKQSRVKFYLPTVDSNALGYSET